MTRTFMFPTRFVSSPETEKERLLYTCTSVASGFYPRHGYLTLPKPIPEYKNYCVILPTEIKKVSPMFWEDARTGGNLMPKRLSKRMWKETKDLYLPVADKKTVKKFEKDWMKIEDKVWEAVSLVFPVEIKWIDSLEIHITNLGSLGSHYLLEKKRGQTLKINLRIDSNFHKIIDLIILSLIYPYHNELGLSFTHRQTLRNFILKRPPFDKLYPGYVPKTFHNPKIPLIYKRKSKEYLKYLGIVVPEDPKDIIRKNMEVFGPKEEKLVNLLLKHDNELVTYDEIADHIWGQGEFKSYWAINKIVQRISKKMKGMEVTGLSIEGIRSRGYKLVV